MKYALPPLLLALSADRSHSRHRHETTTMGVVIDVMSSTGTARPSWI
jgi:hypothetical protein